MIINMREARTHLSRLVEKAAAGHEVIIGKARSLIPTTS